MKKTKKKDEELFRRLMDGLERDLLTDDHLQGIVGVRTHRPTVPKDRNKREDQL